MFQNVIEFSGYSRMLWMFQNEPEFWWMIMNVINYLKTYENVLECLRNLLTHAPDVYTFGNRLNVI